jgi:hypothetical protein
MASVLSLVRRGRREKDENNFNKVEIFSGELKKAQLKKAQYCFKTSDYASSWD